ncbi:MAG: hypothetical protein EOO68_32750, partial [Moraxellaceae bacterium]
MAPVWGQYLAATNTVKTPFFTRDKLTEENWNTFAAAMTGTVNFQLPVSQITIALKYDDTLHKSAMTAIGGTATRVDLLKAWVNKENDRHWGAGETEYRISEGGSDEVGSIGFSQIWFSYLYGAVQGCKPLEGVNMYHPHNNLLGFAVWAGSDKCGGAFYRSFNTNDYVVTVAPETANRLAGVQCIDEQSKAKVCAYKPDDYERLAKGLIVYNAGPKRLGRCALAEMLAGGVIREEIECGVNRTKGQGLDYPLTILHGGTATDTRFLTLPYRTFVWVGERYAADIKLADGKRDPKAGTAKWCFVYGEKEWVKPDKFLSNGKEFLGTYSDYKNRAIDD